MAEWRAVVGFEGLYEVSDDGRVRSLDRVTSMRDGRTRRSRGQVLKPFPCKGYPNVELCRDSATFRKAVHHAVLEAFVGPRPEGREGCHNDGVITNCNASNLRWDTRSGNAYDTVEHGTNPWLRVNRERRAAG